MGGLENFSVEDQGGVDQAALELLRERMRQGQAQAKTDQKKEAKQKKKETNLAQVLIALLKKEQSGLIKVVTQALNVNIPAYFIIDILALRFEALRREIGLEFKTATAHPTPESDSKSLVPANFADSTLPLQVRVEVDIWLNFLIEEAKREPIKLLETARHHSEPKQANTALKSLIGYVMQDYLQLHHIDFIGQNVLSFASNFSDSLIDYLSDFVAQQKHLA